MLKELALFGKSKTDCKTFLGKYQAILLIPFSSVLQVSIDKELIFFFSVAI